jgi:hypothetical protein
MQTTMLRRPDNFAAYRARLEAEAMKWRLVDECYPHRNLTLFSGEMSVFEFCAHPRNPTSPHKLQAQRATFEVSRLQYHFSIRIRRRGFDPNQQKKGVA